MAFARKLLSATKRTTTNLLSTTQADSPTTVNGWTAGGTSTCVAGSTPGPFGFGTSALFTAGASGARTLTLTVGAFGNGGARFALFVKPGTATSLVLGLNDSTNGLLHYASFNVSGGVPTFLALGLGANRGQVMPYKYDNGWYRIEVEYIPGANGGPTTLAASTLQAYLQVNGPSATCELWGALIENGTDFAAAVADGTSREFVMPAGIQTEDELLVADNEVFVDIGVTATRYAIDSNRGKVVFDTPPAAGHTIKCARMGRYVTPYLSGLISGLELDATSIAGRQKSFGGFQTYAGNELPLFRPPRVKDEQGVFYTEWLNTPSGAMKLQGRSDPTASWFDLVSITQANLNGSGQYSVLVTLMPEMRVILPTVGNTTVTFTAWIDE